jgi:hypothetical protein
MENRRKGLWWVAAASVVLVSSPRLAHAQDDSSADTAAARKLGVEGVTLADAGNCQEAIDKLSRSEKIHHAVSVLERLGECQVRLGKLVDGTETLRRVVREQLAHDAPPAFVAAQERAQRVLAEAKPRMARLKVAVAAPPDAQTWVKIDGVTEPTANLNTDRLVDPGDHVVQAGAPGYLPVESKVHVGEGGADSVALTLQPDPAPKAAPEPVPAPPPAVLYTPPQPPSPPPPPPAPPAPPARNRTAAFVAGGVGVVGIGVGVGFALAANSEKSDLDRVCTSSKVCPPSAQSTLDSGTRFGNVSTVAFIVGGVGLVTGAVLYFWDFGGHGQQENGAAQATGPRARAWVAPGSAGIAGSF